MWGKSKKIRELEEQVSSLREYNSNLCKHMKKKDVENSHLWEENHSLREELEEVKVSMAKKAAACDLMLHLLDILEHTYPELRSSPEEKCMYQKIFEGVHAAWHGK